MATNSVRDLDTLESMWVNQMVKLGWCVRECASGTERSIGRASSGKVG